MYFQSEDNNFATSYCQDCEEHLCDECVAAHKRLKLTKGHKINPIEVQSTNANQSVGGSASVAHDLRCKTHPSEKLVHFCETCETLICQDCKSTDKHK